MKKRESLSGQVITANLLLVVAALFAASAASSLDLRLDDDRFQFGLLAMTVVLVLLLNILMLRRRFDPLEQLIQQVEAIDPADPAQFEAPEDPVEEVERLAHSFARLLERIDAERRRAGRLQLRAQEEERKRVARDLHDEVNQALTAIVLRLEALAQAAPPELAAELADTKKLAGQAMEELLQLARQLRPTALDDHGVVPAIQDQVRRFQAQHGVEARLDVSGAIDQIGDDQQLVLYRVTQEALNNVARHAGASQVVVTLARHDGRVSLAVTDDGSGFDPGAARGGLGLDGMAERARLVGGELTVRAGPRGGTRVELEVPSA